MRLETSSEVLISPTGYMAEGGGSQETKQSARVEVISSNFTTVRMSFNLAGRLTLNQLMHVRVVPPEPIFCSLLA